MNELKQIKEKKFRKVKMDYKVNLAFEFLYLFEEHLPDFDDKRLVMTHLRSIEDLLQKRLFFSRDFFLDEVLDYELYLVGYDYKNERR